MRSQFRLDNGTFPAKNTATSGAGSLACQRMRPGPGIYDSNPPCPSSHDEDRSGTMQTPTGAGCHARRRLGVCRVPGVRRCLRIQRIQGYGYRRDEAEGNLATSEPFRPRQRSRAERTDLQEISDTPPRQSWPHCRSKADAMENEH